MANKQQGYKSQFRVPDLEAETSDILEYKSRHFNHEAVYRCREMERAAINTHYTLGHQWIELDSSMLVDGVRGYVFKEQESSEDNEMPRPVTNMIAPAVEVELSSLGKRELTPNVVTTSRDPKIEAAAKTAKNVLEDRMKKLGWNSSRELVTYLTVVTGTGILKSYWDETYTDTTMIANPNAMKCIGCETIVADGMVEKEALGSIKHPEYAEELPLGDDPEQAPMAALGACPTCDIPTPMAPYQVGEEEAQNGSDYFGRPLGLQVPKGNTMIEVVSPFDLFPQNAGVGVTPESCKVWGQCTVRDLDWVEERYPEACYDLSPEDPQELMKLHPILGEWSILGLYNPTMDSGIYENHIRVYEIHADKSYRFPLGRSIVIAGDTILENGTLYKKITNEAGELVEVPKVKYGAARFKVRHGEFWGQGLVDDLISPQNRLNGMDAQIIEARERMGSPNLLVPEDADLSGPEWTTGYGSGKIMRYHANPAFPNSKPEVFGSVLMPSESYQERDRTLADMKQVSGPQDIEIGEAPRNISTTSGLQLLGEQAERRRAPRERALIEMFEAIWEHQLKLLWAFRSEPDDYDMKNPEGEWETRQFTRLDLMGQHKVQIEKQAFVNKSLQQSEGTREAMADGLYNIASASARKRILELRNLPTDVNDNENLQVDLGKRQYVDYMEEMIVPVIDETLDDFAIRFEVLGNLLNSDQGKRKEKSIGWSQILKIITGWELELETAEMADQAAIQFYGSRNLPPEQANVMYAQGTVAFQAQEKSFNKMNESAEKLAAEGTPIDPMMMPQPPQPPPPPVFLPAAKADRIYMIWKNMIAMKLGGGMAPAPGMPPPELLPPEVDSFLQFRAVVDAYRKLAEEKALKSMMGMPAMGAPSGSPDSGMGQPGGQPGLDFANPPNPPNSPNPPVAPGVGGQSPKAGPNRR